VLKLHTLTADDVTALIELDIKQIKTQLGALLRHLKNHADDLGPDASHWLRDLSDATESFDSWLDIMECESCGKLAVWLHPDAGERYCEEHAADFSACSLCGQTMHIRDVVSDAAGVNQGHEHCLHPEADHED
jgi:hypothetical protein